MKTPFWRYEPPPPSEFSCDDNGPDESFLVDPEEFFDELPLPFRFINQFIQSVLDNVLIEIWKKQSPNESLSIGQGAKQVSLTINNQTEFQLDEFDDCSVYPIDDDLALIIDHDGITLTDMNTSKLYDTYPFQRDSIPNMIGCFKIDSCHSIIHLIDCTGALCSFVLYQTDIATNIIEIEDIFDLKGTISSAEIHPSGLLSSVCCHGDGYTSNVFKYPKEHWKIELNTMTSPTSLDNEEPTTNPLQETAPTITPRQLTISKPKVILSVNRSLHELTEPAVNLYKTIQSLPCDGRQKCKQKTENTILTAQYFETIDIHSNCNNSISKCVDDSMVFLDSIINGHLSSSEYPCEIAVAIPIPHNQIIAYSINKEQTTSAEHTINLSLPSSSRINCLSTCNCTQLLAMSLDNGLLSIWDRLNERTLLTVQAGKRPKIQIIGCHSNNGHWVAIAMTGGLMLFQANCTRPSSCEKPTTIVSSDWNEYDTRYIELFSFAKWPSLLFFAINTSISIYNADSAVVICNLKIPHDMSLPFDHPYLKRSRNNNCCLNLIQKDKTSAHLSIILQSTDKDDANTPPKLYHCLVSLEALDNQIEANTIHDNENHDKTEQSSQVWLNHLNNRLIQCVV